MVITVYTFKDKEGNKFDSFYTQDYDAARQYAINGNLKVIGNNFEFADSELVDDFTETEQPPMEDRVNAKIEAVAEALLRKQLGPQDA